MWYELGQLEPRGAGSSNKGTETPHVWQEKELVPVSVSVKGTETPQIWQERDEGIQAAPDGEALANLDSEIREIRAAIKLATAQALQQEPEKYHYH